jgi:hypothetical protein
LTTTARLVALLSLPLLVGCGPDRDGAARGATTPSTDEPAFHLRVRLGGEDEITVWKVERSAVEPVQIYSARLSASEREAAVKGLEPFFVKETADPRSRGPDGASSVRLQVEAEPLVPFKYVQWVMMIAASPRVKIYRVSLLGRTASEHVDLDMPKDRSCCPGQRVPMRELHLKYSRVPGPTEPMTRIRIGDALVEYDDGYMSPTGTEETADAEQLAKDHDSKERTVDLGSRGAGGSDSQAWRAIEQELRARWPRGERAVGIIDVPPPTGGDTPYGDVLIGMLLLRGLGVEQVMQEGAITRLREEQGR